MFAEGAAAEEAQSAGADVVGADALVAEIQESRPHLYALPQIGETQL